MWVRSTYPSPRVAARGLCNFLIIHCSIESMPHDLELLAPAGDWDCFEAALNAGADAVYLGLRTLNARRRAKNFSPQQFVQAVEAAHAKGAKVYLTLNIDLAQRELGQAARILELARQSQADAVLVRDPALLALRGNIPNSNST